MKQESTQAKKLGDNQPSRLVTIETSLLNDLVRQRNRFMRRHHLLYAISGSFGLVATFYGFEHIIDQSQFLVDNPLILLAVGLVTLLATGAIYQKLG